MMNRTHTLVALTAALALIACGKSPTPPPELPAPPSITSFGVDKTRINLGESVTLSWSVEHATSVEFFDDAGVALDLEGDPGSGKATASPTRSTFFVLRAKGEGGRDAAFVQVAVGGDLEEVFLVAVPPEVEAGEPALLLWSAHRARLAKLQTSAGQELPLPAAQGSGVLEVTPQRTVAYTLVASGVNPAQTLTRTAQVGVRPVVGDFSLSAGAAKVGEALELRWKTRGAGELVLSEATFGELVRATYPAQTAQVDEGTHSFTIPATLPGGEEVLDGQPLKFTLSVRQSNPQVVLTRLLHAHVGEGPRVVNFEVPAAVTEQAPLTLRWNTRNATRLQLYAGGALIYEPLPTQQAKVTEGSYTLPAPAADTTYQLRAWSHLGAQVSVERQVRVVKAPLVDSFDLPTTVNQPGGNATATWTTRHATSALLRVKQGPNLAVIAPGALASGNLQLPLGQSLTVVLEAYNDAGDVATAERTVAVAAQAALTGGPSPTTAGSQISVEWVLDPGITSSVVGDPTQPPLKSNPGPSWLDLSLHAFAQELFFNDELDGVSRLPLNLPFRFPIASVLAEEFWVSVDGFVAFAPTGPRPLNLPLSTSQSLPPMVAPFWDDLELGSGKVLWVVEGESFPRRLIIQWHQVRTAADDQSELNFQLHLLETGEMSFAYGLLSGMDSAGEQASVGWRAGPELNRELSVGGALLTPGDEQTFFSSGGLSGSYAFAGHRPVQLVLFAQLPSGRYVPYVAGINVFEQGSVAVNEAMVLPSSFAPLGQWVELSNRTSREQDLSGTVLTSTANGSSWTLPEGTFIPAQGFLVVGASTEPIENGGAPVEWVWSGFSPETASDDLLELSANGQVISSLGYQIAQVVQDRSVQTPEPAIDQTGAKLVCDRTRVFGDYGQVGTPGAANEVCFEYSVASIPGGWEDISAQSPDLLGTSTTGFRQYTLEVPFTYFGQQYDQVSISNNGFLTLSHTLTAVYATNKVAPSTALPTGTVAPFWMSLVKQTAVASGTGALRAARRPGYTVISWENFRVNSGGDNSKLHFQVKLFDTGVIEFHYGVMGASTLTSYLTDHTGTKATTWLERPNGTLAIPINIKVAGVISEQSGYRFIPNE